MGKAGGTIFGISLLAGIFLYYGIDPEGMVIDVLLETLVELVPPEFKWMAVLFTLLITVMGLLNNVESVLEVVAAGGFTLATAVCGFIGGFTVVPLPNLGVWLIIIGIFIGAISPN